MRRTSTVIGVRTDRLDAYERLHAAVAPIAADPETRRWRSVVDPCQEPLATCAPREHWARLDEVFHLD